MYKISLPFPFVLEKEETNCNNPETTCTRPSFTRAKFEREGWNSELEREKKAQK